MDWVDGMNGLFVYTLEDLGKNKCKNKIDNIYIYI